jgi:AcrR family transcriptional regulator
MSHVAPTASSVREPRQARSRASWDRVVAVGRDLLAEGGYDALTISEVCRRAGVTAPSIYARVDGRTGLFRAVYEDVMRDVAASEDELLAAAEPSVAGGVRATAAVFDRHEALLRAVIRQAVEDPWLLSQGATTSRRLQSRIAAALGPQHGVDARAAASAARVVYEACVFRTIYGSRFWDDDPETLEAFCARLTRVAERILETA